MPRILLATLFTVVIASLPAQATAHPTGPTPQEAIEIADRWAAKDAPAHVNYCAGGRSTITRSNAVIDAVNGMALGFAEGWYWTGTTYAWDSTRCTWTTRENLSAATQCMVDAHEMMHFVIGPEHVGPLDPQHPGPVECFTHAEPLPEPPIATPKRVRRTQAQINRSIRYRKAQARSRTRSTMRRLHAR